MKAIKSLLAVALMFAGFNAAAAALTQSNHSRVDSAAVRPTPNFIRAPEPRPEPVPVPTPDPKLPTPNYVIQE